MTTKRPKTAVIFAAGFGKRMLPLTEHTPKPLIKVAGKPMLDYTFKALEGAGIEHIIVNTHHLHQQVEAHVKAACPSHIHLTISHESPTILETGGGIVQALPHINEESFFTINGDIIWHDAPNKPTAIEQLCSNWQPELMDMLLLVQNKESAIGYDGKGDFNLSGNRLQKDSTAIHNYVFTGIQLIKRSLFENLAVEPFSLNRFYQQAQRDDNTLSRVCGTPYQGTWLHVGTPKNLKEAEQLLKKI